MSNTSINLPCPSANGVGAATDLSSMGFTKTIVVSDLGDCTVNIEINNAASSSDGSWAPVATFTSTGSKIVAVVGRWWRARVSGYRGGSPQVDVAASDAGSSFVDLPMAGTAVDVGELPMAKTIQIGGPFRGAINVEISTDGATDWATAASFQRAGQQTIVATANWMRATANIVSGTPLVYVGAADDVSQGNATQYVFVWRPGGVRAANVYPDLAELCVAAQLVEGQKIIEVDSSLATAEISPGTYDMTNCRLMGSMLVLTGAEVIILEDQVFLTGLRIIGPALTITRSFNDGDVNAPVANPSGVIFIDDAVIAGNRPFFSFDGEGLVGQFRLSNGANLIDDTIDASLSTGLVLLFVIDDSNVFGVRTATNGGTGTTVTIRSPAFTPTAGENSTVTALDDIFYFPAVNITTIEDGGTCNVGVVNLLNGAEPGAEMSLPLAAANRNGIAILKSIPGSETVTITPQPGETIDDETTLSVTDAEVYWLVSDGGTNWVIIVG